MSSRSFSCTSGWSITLIGTPAAAGAGAIFGCGCGVFPLPPLEAGAGAGTAGVLAGAAEAFVAALVGAFSSLSRTFFSILAFLTVLLFELFGWAFELAAAVLGAAVFLGGLGIPRHFLSFIEVFEHLHLGEGGWDKGRAIFRRLLCW